MPQKGTGSTGSGSALSNTELTTREQGKALKLEIEESWLEAALLYQNIAKKTNQPSKSAFYLRSALMLYYDEQYDDIEPFFNSLESSSILELDMPNKETILAGSFIGIGKIYQGLLALPDIEEIDDLEYKIISLKIRSEGLLLTGKPLESARTQMEIGPYLNTNEKRDDSHRSIWNTLSRISESRIVEMLGKQQGQDVRGWLELKLIALRSDMLPVKLQPWITQWYQTYSGHPAGSRFALNLIKDSKRLHINPTKITLMLPLSGRLTTVSEAIQGGFLYAYYQNNENNATLEIIDASDDPSIFNLQYQQAIQNGAEFIVGPISKNLINQLQQRDELEVPTLTLNYGDSRDHPSENLYQFGLRPEDEAEQIADYARAQNKRHAITLVPNTNWGLRLQKAFSERFESLGGHVVGAESYPSKKNDYSAAITKLLNLTNSNQRHKIIQQVIGEQVKFDPRRRSDIDMIFIAANSRQARLIKPQLKFHHAQNVPVYATSHISSNNSDTNNDRDLDGIQFVDTPWMFNQANNDDHQAIKKLWPAESNRFSRLFALGIDAYRLIPALRRLMIQPGETANHHTGQLSVDSNGRVRRHLLTATYKKGVANLIESAYAKKLETKTSQ